MYKNAKVQSNRVKEPHYSQIIVKIIINIIIIIIIIIICTLCMLRRAVDYNFCMSIRGLKALAPGFTFSLFSFPWYGTEYQQTIHTHIRMHDIDEWIDMGYGEMGVGVD